LSRRRRPRILRRRGSASVGRRATAASSPRATRIRAPPRRPTSKNRRPMPTRTTTTRRGHTVSPKPRIWAASVASAESEETSLDRRSAAAAKKAGGGGGKRKREDDIDRPPETSASAAATAVEKGSAVPIEEGKPPPLSDVVPIDPREGGDIAGALGRVKASRIARSIKAEVRDSKKRTRSIEGKRKKVVGAAIAAKSKRKKTAGKAAGARGGKARNAAGKAKDAGGDGGGDEGDAYGKMMRRKKASANQKQWRKRIRQVTQYEKDHPEDKDVLYNTRKEPEGTPKGLAKCLYNVRMHELRKEGEAVAGPPANRVVDLTEEKTRELRGLGVRLPELGDREEEEWARHVRQLVRYKEENGPDCRLDALYNEKTKTPSTPGLARWLSGVRREHRLMKESSKGKDEDKNGGDEDADGPPAPAKQGIKLTEERVVELENLGVQWHGGEVWELRFKEFEAYKAEHGHIELRTGKMNSASLNRLVKWLKSQNYQRRDGRLSADKIQKLDELGHNWTTRSHHGRYTHKWNERFDKLKKFVCEFGHADIPTTHPEYAELSQFNKYNRQKYNKANRGEECTYTLLTAEQIRRLESIGFDFAVQKIRKRKTWDERYNQLLEFHEENGHCRVPCRYSKVQLLPRWMETQRVEMRMLFDPSSPGASKLTIEQFRKLELIGFKFEAEERSPEEWCERPWSFCTCGGLDSGTYKQGGRKAKNPRGPRGSGGGASDDGGGRRRTRAAASGSAQKRRTRPARGAGRARATAEAADEGNHKRQRRVASNEKRRLERASKGALRRSRRLAS